MAYVVCRSFVRARCIIFVNFQFLIKPHLPFDLMEKTEIRGDFCLLAVLIISFHH